MFSDIELPLHTFVLFSDGADSQFVNRAHMLLSSNTLVNLYVCVLDKILTLSEIYRNQTDGGQYGTLLWLLDQ